MSWSASGSAAINTARRLFVAASLESAVTIIAVTGATMYFVMETGVPVGAPVAAFALAFGLCASASSATSADPEFRACRRRRDPRRRLDDVLPIVIATVAFAVLPGPSSVGWTLALAPIAIGVAVGLIGWLLFERAESAAERAVYVLGALSLAGGAVYLRASPLAVGLVAGVFWWVAPGRADRIVHDDLRKVQHPLVVLLLVTAGALEVPSAVSVWLLAPYLLFRLAGKVAGAWVSAGFLEVRAADLAAFLMPPGVLAVAFALNFRQMLPAESGETLVSAVAVGTAAFELFALAVVPHWRRRSSA